MQGMEWIADTDDRLQQSRREMTRSINVMSLGTNTQGHWMCKIEHFDRILSVPWLPIVYPPFVKARILPSMFFTVSYRRNLKALILFL